MSKFDNFYNQVFSTLNEQNVTPTSNIQGSNNDAAVSDVLVKLLKVTPPGMAVAGIKSGVQAGKDLGQMGIDASRKVASAGKTALAVVKSMPKEQVKKVISDIAALPQQIKDSVKANLQQAGLNTVDDVINIIKGIGKQKGLTDQEMEAYKNFKERIQNMSPEELGQHMQG